ncbi:MAG: glutathione S-transferase family protein [Cohaesibacter sp.]|nr:glutathione S-transferase family protein [Cohaesibacter sp.]
MLKFYGYNTINSLKILMCLLETGLDYDFIPINIRKGEQHSTDFRALNPAGKVPVISDEGRILAESNAILLYLAKKAGWGLTTSAENIDKINIWLFYQASSQGPYFGQVEYWSAIAKTPNADALAHYTNGTKDSIAYLNKELENQKYLCADIYSIADIALFSWINECDHLGLSLEDAPNIARWSKAIKARPATTKAIEFFGDKSIFTTKKPTE